MKQMRMKMQLTYRHERQMAAQMKHVLQVWKWKMRSEAMKRWRAAISTMIGMQQTMLAEQTAAEKRMMRKKKRMTKLLKRTSLRREHAVVHDETR